MRPCSEGGQQEARHTIFARETKEKEKKERNNGIGRTEEKEGGRRGWRRPRATGS